MAVRRLAGNRVRGGKHAAHPRPSFTGEFGYELYVRVENAISVYESIAAAGQVLGLVHCAHFALESCGLEKGGRPWGHDIDPHDTLLEAGLGVTVAWDKPGSFIGRDALLMQRAARIERRLLQFEVAGAHPLLLHDEPVRRHGTLVGHTTSGAGVFAPASRCASPTCRAPRDAPRRAAW